MKKLKIVFMATAIFLGIGGAFASRIRAKTDCSSDTQYYLAGQNYFQAGGYGDDYYCQEAPFDCTYYKPNPLTEPNSYAPCVIGAYTPIY
ncbi:MAG: DUF6520 family protein [Puia sp.]|nr:DUF6520 family protein [Puia sp.]